HVQFYLSIAVQVLEIDISTVARLFQKLLVNDFMVLQTSPVELLPPPAPGLQRGVRLVEPVVVFPEVNPVQSTPAGSFHFKKDSGQEPFRDVFQNGDGEAEVKLVRPRIETCL